MATDIELDNLPEHSSSEHKKMKFAEENKYYEADEIIYKIDDIPPWYICLILAFQHYLTMFSGAVSVPFLIAPLLCITEENPARGLLVCTTLLVSGIATLVQTIIGSRLPIIQGPSLSFLIPTIAILSQPQWKCPSEEQWANATMEYRDEQWKIRMREVQGAIIIASLVEMFIALTGIIGFLMKWITPLAITPTITLIGLNLFKEAAKTSAQNWGIAALTMGLLIAFSQYMVNLKLPFPIYTKKQGWYLKWFPVFKLFPVMLTILISWGLCVILTATNVLSDNGARTDFIIEPLSEAKWFLLLYPGQWGWPTISAGAVIGVVAGVAASVIESIGDYYACARLAGAPPPPVSAINRGIFAEGIGCALAGCFGTGSGLTSFSQNIGAIAMTKVASRRVIQWTAVIMIMFGFLGKLGVLFMGIPLPIMGGVFCVTFGIVTGVGISNLQYINLNSSRNLFVIGFSIFMGLCIPNWLEKNPDAIQTGSDIGNQIITILLKTSMFVGGFLGCLLDNTVPGVAVDRGLVRWRAQTKGEDIDPEVIEKCYNLPFGMNLLHRFSYFKYFPICPTFKGFGIYRRTNESTRI